MGEADFLGYVVIGYIVIGIASLIGVILYVVGNWLVDLLVNAPKETAMTVGAVALVLVLFYVVGRVTAYFLFEGSDGGESQ